MTAPIASMIRSPAPRTRFSECGESPGGCKASIGLRANSCDMCGEFKPRRSRKTTKNTNELTLFEAIRRFVGGDDQLAARAERHADKGAARDHQLRLGVQIREAI